MLKYLINKPVVSTVLTVIGLGLLATSIVIYPTNTPDTVHAQVNNCGGEEFPSIPNTEDWATSWIVDDWLTYVPSYDGGSASFPIGPYSWEVRTKIKDDNDRSCYYEYWEVTKVVLAWNRDPSGNLDQNSKRGDVFSTEGLEDNNQPKSGPNRSPNLARKQRQNKYNNDYRNDSAFSQTNDKESPLGLYGILNTSKDSLEQSRGYWPAEWKVTGHKVN